MDFISQVGQDRWIAEDVFHRKRDGYFVDVGAYDGVETSNTLVLERDFGWQGLCIEANPSMFEKLRINRGCSCDAACVAGTQRMAEFVCPENQCGGVVANLTDQWRIHWEKAPREQLQTELLVDVFARHHVPRVVDYLSLDIEGSELETLQAFPFDQYRFLALTVEGGCCTELLRAQGYVVWRDLGWETFFLWHEMLDRLTKTSSCTSR